MTADAGIIEKVGQSPDEVGLLAHIVAQPADDSRRLVYANWLEERGDTRGLFLRHFVEASRANKPLPHLGDVPTAWADITGLTISAKIAEAKLQRWSGELLALARPALRIEAGEVNFDDPPPAPAVLGTTRLGGDPDLPQGAEYPTAADGVPLHFLGQFDLANFQGAIAGLFFPPDGGPSPIRAKTYGNDSLRSSLWEGQGRRRAKNRVMPRHIAQNHCAHLVLGAYFPGQSPYFAQ